MSYQIDLPQSERLTMTLNNLPEQKLAALKAYTSALQKHFGNQLLDILLFGSQARGEARAGSDIDLLVILDHPDAAGLSYARGYGFDIWLDYDVQLSIRAMSLQQWQALAAMRSLFYQNVRRDGISLLPQPVVVARHLADPEQADDFKMDIIKASSVT
ncbi:MAG: nucleotidyltransferase domain-containing protein [Ardenticatenaceae bacterium]